MTSFLDLLGDGGHVHFEKCGDIVVSPKDNVVAMFCHFCRDIFTHLPEFIRHVQRSHSDILHFTKEQNVYSVEELLAMESSEDETQSQAHSCSSVDSGSAGEMEDADVAPGSSDYLASNVDIMKALAAFDVEVDGINVNCETQVEEMLLEEKKHISPKVVNSKPEAIQETYYKANYTENQKEAYNSKDFRRARKPGNLEREPTICDVKSYNIMRHSRKREAIQQRLSKVKKRIMLSLENDVPKSVPMKVSCVKLELPAFKEESKHSGVEATKLPPKNGKTKENRSNMTQVIQYNGIKSASMNHLLKPITLSKASSKRPAALTNLKSTTNGSTTLIKPAIPASLRKPLAEKEPKTFRINMPPSKVKQVASNSLSPSISRATKEYNLSPLLNGSSSIEPPAPLGAAKTLNMVSATPIKKRCVASTSIKPTILPCASRPAFKIDPNISHATIGRRSSPIKIERVEILPKIDVKQNVEMSAKGKPIWKKIIPSSVASVKSSELHTNNDAVDQHKSPERRSSLTVVSNSPVQTKKRTRRFSMTTVMPTPPPNLQKLQSGSVKALSKAQKRSPCTEKCDAKRAKIKQERCSTNFSLSSSVIESLQKDLKSSSKLDADSLLQLAEPREDTIIEDLVAQIKETKEERTQQKELSTPQTPEIKVLGDDLKLLETVGLCIIKVPKFEDKLLFEQSEEFRKKAAKFSKMYHKYETIWNYRKSKNIGATERLVQQLNAFTEEVNKELACHLTLSEMKRILNLINSWYAEQIDQRFFRKATLTYSIEHYMLLFHFLPKIITTVYFCEYCEETFTHESRYKKHVQSLHTLHAFTCSECGKSFKRLYFYEKHLQASHNVSPVIT
ncbi:protein teflon isoform X2 [Drosophila guanche]|uniref:protein teflon isoform X2 n=1 Tax=Drosophila guanche TaxID=7266 RepID=UPI00147216FE|nr:protein teflon isoform X2 [Drosophila guanche]